MYIKWCIVNDILFHGCSTSSTCNYKNHKNMMLLTNKSLIICYLLLIICHLLLSKILITNFCGMRGIKTLGHAIIGEKHVTSCFIPYLQSNNIIYNCVSVHSGNIQLHALYSLCKKNSIRHIWMVKGYSFLIGAILETLLYASTFNLNGCPEETSRRTLKGAWCNISDLGYMQDWKVFMHQLHSGKLKSSIL